MSGALREGAAGPQARGDRAAAVGSRAAAQPTRRDFLRLRARGNERMLDLSCEALYMRYVEAGAACALAEGADASACGDAPSAYDHTTGEPPTAIAVLSKGELLDDLSRRLGDADRLEVHGAEWLVGDFGRDVRARLDAFRARGGKVT